MTVHKREALCEVLLCDVLLWFYEFEALTVWSPGWLWSVGLVSGETQQFTCSISSRSPTHQVIKSSATFCFSASTRLLLPAPPSGGSPLPLHVSMALCVHGIVCSTDGWSAQKARDGRRRATTAPPQPLSDVDAVLLKVGVRSLGQRQRLLSRVRSL